ncbi:MAG TPA: FMN-binding protein [Methylotenera sp.]|nr:FMN-binding protein [Methylotenera sp.]HPV43908.1 FMN-binding protein [Methylotenera sp.]
MNKNMIAAACALLLLVMAGSAQAIQQYLTSEQFLTEAFGNEVSKPQALWLNKETAKQVEKILGHAPHQTRQRYWRTGNSSAWILEEIGKEEPITAGFVVTDGRIAQARILTYRESRGWEVRYPAFLKQFQGAQLQVDDHLNQPVDGISGATLSVNAMVRMARLALYFDRLSRAE